MRHVPSLARGDLEIAAIARYPGVLTKVAVRRGRGIKLSARPVSLVVGLGADYVNRVSAELGGERLHVLQWQGDPTRYIAEALGIGYVPAMQLSPSTRLANVLLGDIDVRGVRGRKGINLLLASALTGWRIRLREIARSPAWKTLESARLEHRSVPASVQARVSKGLAVSIYGLERTAADRTGARHSARNARRTSGRGASSTPGAGPARGCAASGRGHRAHLRIRAPAGWPPVAPAAGNPGVSERTRASTVRNPQVQRTQQMM